MSATATDGQASTADGGLGVHGRSQTERVAIGKQARAAVPRALHAEWAAAPDRPDPLTLLEEQARQRVPELVPVRYGRMLVSPFTFYRGSALIMASDLAGTPRTGLTVQLCGDAHLSNFGVYAAPDRRLVFSINDFDETLPGPFEWDVKRLVASFAVAGRDRGFGARQRAAIARTATRAYREAMTAFAGMRTLDLWHARLDVDEIRRQFVRELNPKTRARFEQNVAKARTKDGLKAVGKLTTIVDGERRIASDPPVIVPIEDIASGDNLLRLEDYIRGVIDAYRETLPGDRRHLLERFRYAHAARKVVGVGSVGTRAWIVLMLGRDQDDPLVLQAKEANASVLEGYLGASEYATHGQRVVEGQHLTQAASDIMLGWLRVPGVEDDVDRDFYVRQLWDAKGSALVEVMEPSTMDVYARVCGWSLAKAHARSGDAVAISAYLGTGSTFDRAIAEFAETYADQNERDYASLRAAADAGQIQIEAGV